MNLWRKRKKEEEAWCHQQDLNPWLNPAISPLSKESNEIMSSQFVEQGTFDGGSWL